MEFGIIELVFIISSNQNCSPEWDSNLGLSRIVVFEDCKATALTTQPPKLDPFVSYHYNKNICSEIINLEGGIVV